jgi:UDP-GlcNAc3NAcA epimerase
MANLRNEGRAECSVLSGDVMLDAVDFNRTLVTESRLLRELGLEANEYVLVTVHRADNTEPEVLHRLLEMLSEVAADYRPVIFPMHPRTKNILRSGGASIATSDRLHIVEPIGYFENLFLIEHARLVMTDSGGLQKEAFFLDTPCITLRGETEWLETVAGGGNRVVGTNRADVLGAVDLWEAQIASAKVDFAAEARARFGNGKASDTIVEHLVAFCAERRRGRNDR